MRVEDGAPRRVGRVVGVEHIASRRLRVAAGELAAEELVADLDLVPAGALPVREVGEVAGELRLLRFSGSVASKNWAL